MKKKVSIIIPVYNAEHYLKKCLDSIINQTYKNIEILLMNDGSTDKSLEICNKYKNKYSNIIKVYSHKNQGVALTRNDGIKYATGDYIMFIDNDDFIDKNYIKTYVEEIKNFDAIFGGYKRVDTNNHIINKIILKNYEWSKYMIVAPWAKIYKLDFIKNNSILFLNSNIGEDVYFNFQVINHTNKIKVINYCGYNWFYNTKSISNTIHKKVNNELQFEFLLNSLYETLDDVKKKNIIIEYFFIKMICWFILYTFNNNSYNIVASNYKYYFDWLETKFPNYQKNKYIPQGEKIKNIIGIYLIKKCYKYKLYKIIIKILKRGFYEKYQS